MLGRGPRRGVEDLEAALEQFREIAGDLDVAEKWGTSWFLYFAKTSRRYKGD
jgi:hypothetical protein